MINWLKELWSKLFGNKVQKAISQVPNTPRTTFIPEPEVETWDLAWGKQNSDEFNLEVVRLCQRFGWDENHACWLMGCMAFETGGTFSPSIKNQAGSGATGLIQFMPNTALSLGTTCKALKKMTAVEQLRFVELYFRPYAKRIKSFEDMYMAILMPKYIGLDNSSILMKMPNVAYRQNAGLDLDKDGKITKREAASKCSEWFFEGIKPENSSLVTVSSY